MGFFRSLFEICCGPVIFRRLLDHSWGRVVWHFFLICFFSALFIGICNYILINHRWGAAQGKFTDVFGSTLTISEKGILPVEPEKSRWLELPDNSALVYVSAEDKKIYQNEFFRDRNWFVVWSANAIGFFARNNELWRVAVYFADGKTILPEKEISFDEMKKEFSSLTDGKFSGKWDLPEEPETIKSEQLFAMLRSAFALLEAGGYFLLSFSMIAFITFSFSLLFKLFSAGKSNFISFSQLWKTALYTAFPVLMVVSFFPALQLPGASYFSNLFMIGWVIYLFVVLKYLIENPEAPVDPGKGENNESIQ
ncbi:MAG: YIP1 family protein [Lentisphaeria bacterium]|nr:YIP1 family protein [Lentisphaeria bacterium]